MALFPVARFPAGRDARGDGGPDVCPPGGPQGLRDPQDTAGQEPRHGRGEAGELLLCLLFIFPSFGGPSAVISCFRMTEPSLLEAEC